MGYYHVAIWHKLHLALSNCLVCQNEAAKDCKFSSRTVTVPTVNAIPAAVSPAEAPPVNGIARRPPMARITPPTFAPFFTFTFRRMLAAISPVAIICFSLLSMAEMSSCFVDTVIKSCWGKCCFYSSLPVWY